MQYGVGEVIRGAKDAEDAVKRFKESGEGVFVRPIVCLVYLSVRGPLCMGIANQSARLSTGRMDAPWWEIMSRRF